jgi:hypothetical protein
VLAFSRGATGVNRRAPTRRLQTGLPPATCSLKFVLCPLGGAAFMRALSNAARKSDSGALIRSGCAVFLAEKTGMTRTRFSGNGKRSADGIGGGTMRSLARGRRPDARCDRRCARQRTASTGRAAERPSPTRWAPHRI